MNRSTEPRHDRTYGVLDSVHYQRKASTEDPFKTEKEMCFVHLYFDTYDFVFVYICTLRDTYTHLY